MSRLIAAGSKTTGIKGLLPWLRGLRRLPSSFANGWRRIRNAPVNGNLGIEGRGDTDNLTRLGQRTPVNSQRFFPTITPDEN
jgi:hypothetical protein